ncbi:unnamed protein product [Heligmosomoides polygyrus]|uniref:HYPK_UBA domain-containing protein n=1 Tax=Heligmosomoides polygyrus TaxID=6339 RepID=A0A183GF08_HELPZ|nr:unnamed protein product [Heligmosomoides polygyrus]
MSSEVAQQLQEAVSPVKNLEAKDVDQPGSPKKRKAEDDLDVAVEVVTVKKAREDEKRNTDPLIEKMVMALQAKIPQTIADGIEEDRRMRSIVIAGRVQA